jgi:hypothetical protein
MTHCSRNGGPGNINRLVVGSILNAVWTTRTSEADIPSAADIYISSCQKHEKRTDGQNTQRPCYVQRYVREMK